MKTFDYATGRSYLKNRKMAVPVKVVNKTKRKANSLPLTKVFRLKRTFSQNISLVMSNVSQFSATSVTLSQFPGVSSDLVNLFDKYRIRQLTVRFIPLQREQYSTSATLGQIGTVIDNDDANSPASFDEMRQYPSFKTKSIKDYHTVTFKPYVANALYSGSAFTGYGSMKDAWIDMASTTVVHYGLKIGIQNCTLATGSNLYDLEISGIIEFSKVR